MARQLAALLGRIQRGKTSRKFHTSRYDDADCRRNAAGGRKADAVTDEPVHMEHTLEIMPLNGAGLLDESNNFLEGISLNVIHLENAPISN